MPWNNSRPKSAQYGSAHAKARAAAARHHQPTDPCTRCGHALGPMGPGLHYDHTDDRRAYAGFAHGSPCRTCGIRCNVVAGARKGSRNAHRRRNVSELRW